MTPTFTERARSAIETAPARFRPQASPTANGPPIGDGFEVLAGRPPHGLAARVLALGIAGLVAAILGTVVLRWSEISRFAALDESLAPLVLLVAVLFLIAAARTAIVAAALVRHLHLRAHSRRAALVLGPDQLFYRCPAGTEHTMAARDVIAVRSPGDWSRPPVAARARETYLVFDQGGAPAFLCLPPIFGMSAGTLSEHLMRWLGTAKGQDDGRGVHPGSDRVRSTLVVGRLFDDLAAGKRVANTVGVRHGRRWLLRGPYATAFLGVALIAFLATRPDRALIGVEMKVALIVGGVVALLVPVGWVVFTWASIAPRRGYAFLLTNHELLVRLRSGILRTNYTSIAALKVVAKVGWSVLEGQGLRRVLVIERRNAPPIRYEEAFLGMPIEVAIALIDACRSGRAFGSEPPGAHESDREPGTGSPASPATR